MWNLLLEYFSLNTDNDCWTSSYLRGERLRDLERFGVRERRGVRDLRFPLQENNTGS